MPQIKIFHAMHSNIVGFSFLGFSTQFLQRIEEDRVYNIMKVAVPLVKSFFLEMVNVKYVY